MMSMSRNTRFSFVELFAKRAAIVRPFEARMAKIHAAYEEWWARELARPTASLQGAAPEEVQSALDEEARKRTNAVRALHEQSEGAINAELKALTDEVRTNVQTALGSIDRLHTFLADRGRFAAECGMPTPAVLDLRGYASVEFEDWQRRVDRALNPPAPRPFVRVSENRLDLNSVLS